MSMDPLSGAASGVNTSFPELLPGQTVEVKCVSAEFARNPKNTCDMLTLKLETTKETQLVGGGTQQPGFPLWARVVCSETGKMTWDKVRVNVAKVIQSFMGAATTIEMPQIREPQFLQGQIGTVKTKMGRVSAEYPDPKVEVEFVPPAVVKT